MINKFLMICAFALCTCTGIQSEEVSPAQQIKRNTEAVNQLDDEEETQTSTLAASCKCCKKKGRKDVKNQQEENQTPALATCCKCGQKKGRKDQNAGVLVCNGSEEHCVKAESFCGDRKDEKKLLACKDCQ